MQLILMMPDKIILQELCMLLDDYWERTNLKVPIYFSAGIPSLPVSFHQIGNWFQSSLLGHFTVKFILGDLLLLF